jgi:hypothetical protein
MICQRQVLVSKNSMNMYKAQIIVGFQQNSSSSAISLSRNRFDPHEPCQTGPAVTARRPALLAESSLAALRVLTNARPPGPAQLTEATAARLVPGTERAHGDSAHGQLSMAACMLNRFDHERRARGPARLRAQPEQGFAKMLFIRHSSVDPALVSGAEAEM